MPVDPIDPLRPLPSDVIAADDDAATVDAGTLREVFRARHRLAVSVFERAKHYRVNYSLGDIHRLTFLSHDERSAVAREWHAWHRRYGRLGKAAMTAWVGGAGVAWALWFRGELAVGGMQAVFGAAIPLLWVQALGALIAGLLLVTFARFLASVSAPALCDAYLQGYADGLTRGVNRALRITPEVEKEMWDELRDAERQDAQLQRGAVRADQPASRPRAESDAAARDALHSARPLVHE